MVNYNSFGFSENLTKNDQETIRQINEIRKKHNFRAVKRIVGAERLVKLLKKLYPKNDIKTIERIMNIPDSTLAHWFKNFEIPFVRRHVSTAVFPANFDGSTVTTHRNTAKNFSAIKIDGNLSYLIGFCIGDGAIQKYMVEAFNKDVGMKDYLKTTMQRYGIVQEVIRADGLWKLRLSSVKIAALIKRNGKIVEGVLEYILSDKDLAPKFVAGFWDAEGSVLKQAKYTHVYLYNSNKELLERISKYLEKHNIKNSIIKVKKRTQPYYLNGRQIIARKQIYRLGVPKSSLKKWRELIGLHLKHSKKTAVVCEIG